MCNYGRLILPGKPSPLSRTSCIIHPTVAHTTWYLYMAYFVRRAGNKIQSHPERGAMMMDGCRSERQGKVMMDGWMDEEVGGRR